MTTSMAPTEPSPGAGWPVATQAASPTAATANGMPKRRDVDRWVGASRDARAQLAGRAVGPADHHGRERRAEQGDQAEHQRDRDEPGERPD